MMDLPFYISNALKAPGWISWSGNIFLIGLIALFVLVILHMLAHALNLVKLKNWVKGEYLQVVATVLIAYLLVGSSVGVWFVTANIIKSIYFSSQPWQVQEYERQYGNINNIIFDPFEFNQYFIKEAILGCQKTVYSTLYVINGYYRVMGGTLKIDAQGSEPKGGTWTTMITSPLEYLMAKLSRGMLFSWINITMLGVIKYVAPLLIQLGLIFRILPYTRGFGAFLLAAGFGFLVIYPISLALLLQYQPPSSWCNEIKPPAQMLQKDGVSLDFSDYAESKRVILANEKEISQKIDNIKNLVILMYIQGFIYPFVSLTLVFTFIRQFSNLLGSDLNEIGRGLIKLI